MFDQASKPPPTNSGLETPANNTRASTEQRAALLNQHDALLWIKRLQDSNPSDENLIALSQGSQATIVARGTKARDNLLDRSPPISPFSTDSELSQPQEQLPDSKLHNKKRTQTIPQTHPQ